jgi:hypothetical protein
MRVCTSGEGSGSDLGAGGSGNGAGGSEIEYDGRVAGIGASAGMEGDMGRSGQIGGGGKRSLPQGEYFLDANPVCYVCV